MAGLTHTITPQLSITGEIALHRTVAIALTGMSLTAEHTYQIVFAPVGGAVVAGNETATVDDSGNLSGTLAFTHASMAALYTAGSNTRSEVTGQLVVSDKTTGTALAVCSLRVPWAPDIDDLTDTSDLPSPAATQADISTAIAVHNTSETAHADLFAATVTRATDDGNALADANRFEVGQCIDSAWVYCVKTGTQIKAWLKTYFNTLYDAAGSAAAVLSQLTSHTGNTSNPHSVSASDIGVEAGADVTDAENVEDAITGADAETTPADAWVLPVVISAVLKKLTFANLKAWLETIFWSYASVTELPTSPVVSRLYRLTAADATAKAGPGIYVHDGGGWVRLSSFAPYTLGNLGATPALVLIPGGDAIAYTAVHDQNITACTVSLTRPGTVAIRKTGEYTFAVPTSADALDVRTRTSDGWTDAAAAVAEILFSTDSGYLMISAIEGVATV